MSGGLKNMIAEIVSTMNISKDMVKSFRMKKKDFQFKLKETKVTYLLVFNYTEETHVSVNQLQILKE